VVTGGGTGLGLMMATTLVHNGAHVIIASRKEQALRETSDQLNKQGPGSCQYIVADVGSKAGCDALCDEIKRRISKVHVLINNSGVTWGAPFNDFPEKQGWDRVLALNIKAPFYVTSGLSDLLAKDATNVDPGRVIMISSVAGSQTNAEDTALGSAGSGLWSYNTSKAALNHLTKTLAVTLGKRKVTVNAICPGIFPSRMTAYGLKTAGDRIAKSYPMGRVGTPEDIGGITLFLSGRASAHISGETILIDGGATIAGKGEGGEPEAKAKL